MSYGLPVKYSIRYYRDEDADQISEIDFLSMLAYRYNRDYVKENIFCAVDSDGNILGFAHLVPDQTWSVIDNTNMPSDFEYKLNVDVSINEELPIPENLLDDLLECLMKKAKEVRKQYPDKRVRVSHTIPTEEKEEIDFYLSKGFDTRRTHLILIRDLTEDIPDYPLPENLHIRKWDMTTQAEQEQYLAAEAKGDDHGISWSLNHLQWTKSGGEWDTFTVFYDNEVVGSVMTWGLGEERSVTENIFVVPEWRRKGIAKAFITEALKFLKEKGKKQATLGVFGDNRRAIALYKSLGYKMFDTVLEFGIDV